MTPAEDLAAALAQLRHKSHRISLFGGVSWDYTRDISVKDASTGTNCLKNRTYRLTRSDAGLK